jgi:hypothetical protein
VFGGDKSHSVRGAFDREVSTYSGCASTRPRTRRNPIFPNFFEFTFAVVSCVSPRYSPVRALLWWYVRTFTSLSGNSSALLAAGSAVRAAPGTGGSDWDVWPHPVPRTLHASNHNAPSPDANFRARFMWICLWFPVGFSFRVSRSL